MNARTDSGERLHALDHLRAAMMWLGIVLHVAAIHTVMESPLPWHDRQTTPWADLLAVVIHSFRMPVFFIVAGFFVAMLVRDRGLRGMLANRLQRLGLVFVLLWPPLYLACGVLALLFLHRMARGTWGIDETLMPVTGEHPKINTMHLWFIWMLWWFSLLTALLAPLSAYVDAPVRHWLSSSFQQLASSRWGVLLLAVPLALVGAFCKNGVVMASGEFLPPLTEWLYNGLFFVFGLALFAHRDALLALYRQRWPSNAALGLLLFVALFALTTMEKAHPGTIPNFLFWLALFYGLCTWLWSLALIGFFLRYLGRQNAVLGYLAQSAYWVYLIHLPATIGFGALLYDQHLAAGVKMLLNIGASTVFSLLTYHLLVRSTLLGSLLNSRRYPFASYGLGRRALT